MENDLSPANPEDAVDYAYFDGCDRGVFECLDRLDDALRGPLAALDAAIRETDDLVERMKDEYHG